MSDELEQKILVEKIVKYLVNLNKMNNDEIEEIFEMAIVDLEISEKQKEETYQIIKEELTKYKNITKFKL